MSNDSTTIWIAERAKELGFAMSGIVRATNFPELARTGEWLERGYAGNMKYLSDARRGVLQSAMPGVRSVIVCALMYNTAHSRTSQAAEKMSAARTGGESPRGWISRYAWGSDYHEVLRAKLETLLAGLRDQCPKPFKARVYADTGPLNERVLARHAGLGWLGKNTLLLNEQLGSYFFLGVILTDLDLQPALETAEAALPDRCGTCRKCIDACPTQALVEPYVMDARKCISYLTIELRGPIPVEFREAMGQHTFGCDICQDVCPWNRNAPVTQANEFQPRTYEMKLSQTLASAGACEPEDEMIDSGGTSAPFREWLFLPRLEWLACLDHHEFNKLFHRSPIKRTKWRGLVRNACIALGNSKLTRKTEACERILALLSRLGASDDPVVAESAQWAVSRIQESDGRRDEHPASCAIGELAQSPRTVAGTKSEGQAL
ncbi:MAG: tRNA epoxyqueuosine(34) reductase QueG [Acidobacteriota bacterium]|nr:tRNA epoxyqueuosine(34) reductase QueG [Acidobacteriota bacterium]